MICRSSASVVRRCARLALALPVVLPLLTASPALAQMYNAGDPCPEPTPGRVFTQEGAAGPALVCNGTTLEVYESIKTGPMRKGVGTANPAAMLDVAGEAKIGNTSLACSATTEGAMRYNSTSKEMEYCNGTAWGSLAPAAGSSGCPITGNTVYYSVGGNTAYCQATAVNSSGVVTTYSVNGGQTCDTGSICDNGACISGVAGIGSVQPDGTKIAGVDGGLVLYTTPTNQSSAAYWGTYNYTTGTTTSDGAYGAINQANVYARVMAGNGTSNPDDGYTPNAFVLCHNLTFGGHSDWFLPDYSTLHSIADTNPPALGMGGVYYWTSTEYASTNAYAVYPGSASGYGVSKNTASGYAVRCIRRN